MSKQEQYPGPDPTRSRLRATVAAVGRRIAALPAQPEDTSELDGPSLATSWADLVDQLALGPEPELRTCPACGKSGMRLATVCGHCWTKLTPPPRKDAGTAVD